MAVVLLLRWSASVSILNKAWIPYTVAETNGLYGRESGRKDSSVRWAKEIKDDMWEMVLVKIERVEADDLQVAYSIAFHWMCKVSYPRLMDRTCTEGCHVHLTSRRLAQKASLT